MSDIEEFVEGVKSQIQKTLVLDFDGVIHKGSKGFHDGTVYDDPVKGTADALRILSSKYRLIILSCKADPKRPLIGGKTGVQLIWEWFGKTGVQLIWEWLDKHDFSQYIEDVTHEKVRAKYYIDDKGITFESWSQILEILI